MAAPLHPGRLLVAVDTDYPVPSRIASIRAVVTGHVDDAGTLAQYDGGPPSDTFR